MLGLLALAAGLLVPLAADHAAAAVTINVPADQPTIQAGINAASNGDTVLVAPGTYYELIDFLGKAIEVRSAQGPALTTIEGNASLPVVIFSHGEGAASVIRGFTIQNGLPGIRTSASSPTIVGNVLVDNVEGGISVRGLPTSPLIVDNVVAYNNVCGAGGISVVGPTVVRGNYVVGNEQQGCSGGASGGGINVLGGAGALIEGHLVEDNAHDMGGGIGINVASSVTVRNNVVSGNQGGGIVAAGGLQGGTFVQNLVIGNTAGNGASLRGTQLVIVNNTFAGNASVGIDLPTPTQTTLYNNIVADGLSCGPSAQVSLYSNNSSEYGGPCASAAGMNGNISLAPEFVNEVNGDYRLQSGSPSIDAGDNSAPSLPSLDIAGRPRIKDGTVDQGAFELVVPRKPLDPWPSVSTQPRRVPSGFAGGAGAGAAARSAAASSSLPAAGRSGSAGRGATPAGAAPPATAVLGVDPRFTG